MYCIYCGNKIPYEARYCSVCGREVKENDTFENNNIKDRNSEQVDFEVIAKEEIVGNNLEVHPWARYWARMFDIILYGLTVGLVIGWLLPGLFDQANEILLNVAILFSWIFIESGLLIAFGTTPGKSLFKINLIYIAGPDISYSKVLSRSLKVWWRGFGAGIPPISIVTLIVAYNKLMNNRRTSWDEDCGFIVQHERIGPIRIIFAILFFVAFFIFISIP